MPPRAVCADEPQAAAAGAAKPPDLPAKARLHPWLVRARPPAQPRSRRTHPSPAVTPGQPPAVWLNPDSSTRPYRKGVPAAPSPRSKSHREWDESRTGRCSLRERGWNRPYPNPARCPLPRLQRRRQSRYWSRRGVARAPSDSAACRNAYSSRSGCRQAHPSGSCRPAEPPPSAGHGPLAMFHGPRGGLPTSRGYPRRFGARQSQRGP